MLCAKYYLITFLPKPVNLRLSSYPFYRPGYWGKWKWNNLPKVIKVVNGGRSPIDSELKVGCYPLCSPSWRHFPVSLASSCDHMTHSWLMKSRQNWCVRLLLKEMEICSRDCSSSPYLGCICVSMMVRARALSWTMTWKFTYWEEHSNKTGGVWVPGWLCEQRYTSLDYP